MKHYRIKDIAKLSGVSTGTVDRILHKRGRVSEEAQKKVEKVLKEIDYQPNMIARSLALKKNYRFLTLTPSFEPGDYWSQVCSGIDKAESELHYYNIEVIRKYFDQYDNSSFDRLIDEIKEDTYEGVIIATLFRNSCIRLMEELDRREIPYVMIDSYIENTNSLAYYGTDSFISGYIAGRLLSEQIKPSDDILIFHINQNTVSTQITNRRAGFQQYLVEHSHKGHIFTVHLDSHDEEKNDQILDRFFETHPQVHAGIIFNSRVHFLSRYFLLHPSLKHFKMIGYDIVDANIPCLDSGFVSHLISQRPEVQGLNSVKALFRHLVLKEKVDGINYMPMDILMKENVHYYNNYI